MLSDVERVVECLHCKYFEYCINNISNPKDNEDGTCLTKDLLDMKDGKNVKSTTSQSC